MEGSELGRCLFSSRLEPRNCDRYFILFPARSSPIGRIPLSPSNPMRDLPRTQMFGSASLCSFGRGGESLASGVKE